jgi:hypothetical protein
MMMEGPMRKSLNLVRTAVLAAGTAAALGFGARQALAKPAAAAASRACTASNCTTYCQSTYGPDAIGRCSPSGACRCLF